MRNDVAKTVDLSDAEWRIMNVVWEHPEMLAQEVIQAVCEPCGWTPATVRTMLHRLVKKGALRFTADGNRYVYRAAVRRADCVRRAARAFLDHVFQGESAPLLNHFVRNARFSKEELAELRKLLDEQEP